MAQCLLRKEGDATQRVFAQLFRENVYINIKPVIMQIAQ